MLHDEYIARNTQGVSGEDNLVDLEIKLLQEKGHEVIDLRGIEFGLRRKILQGSIHVFGFGKGLPKFRENCDVIHVHNLNQRTGYAWLKNSSFPIVQSLHNLRTFCPISIGWRDGNQCFECLDNPTSVWNYQCGGIYGIAGSFRHILFQSNRPQLLYPRRLIASSNMMKNLFVNVFPPQQIDVVHNPGVVATQLDFLRPRKGWIFAGRFVEEKGVVSLIENWPEEETLDIAGNGPLLPKVMALIEKKSNVKYIGTFKNDEKAIYGNYEGFLFASTWMEGSPLVVADAICNGTPVIAFGSSAVIEQIAMTDGGFYMGVRVTKEGLRRGISQVRTNRTNLFNSCLKASSGVLSPEHWIQNIEHSLKLAVNQR